MAPIPAPRAAPGPSAAAPAETAAPPAGERARPKTLLFCAWLVVLLVATGYGVTVNDSAPAGLAVYVVCLGALCGSPLLFVKRFDARAGLLLIYLAFLFLTYGFRNVVELVLDFPTAATPRTALLTAGERAILLSTVCLLLGYALVLAFAPRRPRGILTRDWSTPAMLVMGIAGWSIGFLLTAQFQFAFDAIMRNPFTGVLATLRNLQPIGTLIFTYLLLVRGNRFALVLLLATLPCDFVLGFLGDSKEIAFRGPLLLLLGLVIARGRVPLLWTLAFVLVTGLSFSFFASYRAALGRSFDPADARLEDIGENVDRALRGAASLQDRLIDGLDYLSSRLTLKGNVELVLAEVGKSVDYRRGETLEILLYVFLPRYFFPDKPDTSTGRIFNREFGLSDSADTYISVGNAGELYWNYGWPGIVIGMTVIGAFLALVNVAVDLRTLTLPRFLLFMLTAYLLLVRSEANIGQAYTFWLRTAVVLLLLHPMVPKLSRPRLAARAPRRSVSPRPAPAGG